MSSEQPVLHFEIPAPGGRRLNLNLSQKEWRNISKPLVFDKKGRYQGPFDKLYRFFTTSDQPPSILMFGDSTAIRESWNDQDKRKLVEMLRPLVEELGRTCGMVGAAFNLRMFYYLLKALTKTRNRPLLVVLPINLREFSPQWASHPRYGFEKELSRITSFLETGEPPRSTPNDEQEAWLMEKFEQYWAIPLDYPERPRLIIGDVLKNMLSLAGKPEPDRGRRLKLIFCLHYMFRLERNHYLLNFLRKAMSVLHESGLNSLVYMTPINYQAGLRCVGPDFSVFLEANKKIIHETIDPWSAYPDLRFRDWTTLLDSAFFHHADIANEHLIDEGRLKLAGLIADELNSMASGNASCERSF